MKIASGVVDQLMFFVAVDSADLKTRKTGLTTFTVYRARDTGAATAMTTPTVAELSAANMPGVYSLLLDEDMTIAAGNETEEMAFHITQAAMAPVTRVIELYRPKITIGETLAVSGSAVTTVTTSTNLTTNNDKTGYGLSAAAVQAIWDALTSALTVAGSIGKKLADWVIGTTQTGDSFARLGAPAGASVSADIAAVKTETASIQTDTNDIQARLPAALVGGRIDGNASAINGIATSAARLARSTQGIVLGTVGAASTTTSIVTSALDPAAAVTDQFKGRIVTFDQGTTTANLRGQSTDITASTALGVLTVTALSTAPVSDDTFTIT